MSPYTPQIQVGNLWQVQSGSHMSRAQSGGMCIHAPSITITTCQKSHLSAGRHTETPKKYIKKIKQPRSTWHHPWKTRGTGRAAHRARFALPVALPLPQPLWARPHHQQQLMPKNPIYSYLTRLKNYLKKFFLLPDASLLSRLRLDSRGGGLRFGFFLWCVGFFVVFCLLQLQTTL